MQELLKEIKKQPDVKEYISWRGRKCYMTYGDLDWYFLKCSQYDLEPKMEGDFPYTAKGNGFEFQYCEHDIILSID